MDSSATDSADSKHHHPWQIKTLDHLHHLLIIRMGCSRKEGLVRGDNSAATRRELVGAGSPSTEQMIHVPHASVVSSVTWNSLVGAVFAAAEKIIFASSVPSAVLTLESLGSSIKLQWKSVSHWRVRWLSVSKLDPLTHRWALNALRRATEAHVE
jgi:hypothetical protein